MSKHIQIDEIWVQNRFRVRKRMSGKGLHLDKESGFLVNRYGYGFDASKKKTFLARYTVCSNITSIAKSLFLHIQTVYDHLALDPKFREEYNRLSLLEGKALELNNALLEIGKVEKQALITDLSERAKRYVK